MSDAPDLPPQTQYEMMRDDNFRHLADTEKDDYIATQKLAKRQNKIVGENAVAESGIIESITCCNFMCHERLHVELGPLINFIVGVNGSGKSAVLTGLTLCLGGKASDTNRGGSLKSFIKTDRDHASIIVKIKNAGTDAYQPDVYGESILVERHFSRTGTSGFKIKSSMGRIVSTKKQEVEEICEWYALQIGNPLTVLSQDNARQFLNSATPSQKYKYFVSGVQLEQLDNDYKMSQDHLDKMLYVRDDLDGIIKTAKDAMEDAKKRADAVSKNETLRANKKLYRAQCAWAQVAAQEKELKARQDRVVVREGLVVEQQKTCDKMTQDLEKLEAKVEETKQDRVNLDEEKSGFEERLQAADSKYSAEKARLTDVMREERDAHERLKAAGAAIKGTKQKIEEEEMRLSESTGPERADKDTALKEAKEHETNLKDQLENVDEEIADLKEQAKEAFKAFKSQETQRENKRAEVLAAEKQHKELQKSTGSIYDGYDASMVRLVESIENDGSFQSKPVGPLGAHIRLRRPEWSSILEKTFGDGLNAFVVRSKADQTKLAAKMRQTLKKPVPIYIASQVHIDTRAHEPDDQFTTILRILEFDNDLIRAQMIINYSIEKIILINDRVEAERTMLDSEPPRNVSACLCFHDGENKRGWGLRLTSRGGSINTAPVMPSQMRPRMQSDSAEQLKLQEEQLKHLGGELRQVTADSRRAKQDSDRLFTQSKQKEEARGKLEADIRRAQADIETLSEELDKFEGVDDRLMALKRDLVREENEEEQVGSQYGQIGLAKRELKATVEELKKELDIEKQKQADFSARVNKAEDRISSYETSRRIATAEKNKAFEDLDREKMRLQEEEERVETARTTVDEFISRASESAPERVHIDDDKTYDHYRKKYDEVVRKLNISSQRLGGTDEEIIERALQTKLKYDEVVKKTSDVDALIDSLKATITNRLYLWRQFQRQISARIRIQFTYLLSERGFRGRIELNHRQKKVHIHVEPDETKKSGAGRNTKTLSGGEKSFSSVCMLLSIWEAMGSPIRCLDEFDVFMDNVNRRISTNMLVGVFPLLFFPLASLISVAFFPKTIPLTNSLSPTGLGRSNVCISSVHSHHAQSHRRQRQGGQGRQDHSVRVPPFDNHPLVTPANRKCSDWETLASSD